MNVRAVAFGLLSLAAAGLAAGCGGSTSVTPASNGSAPQPSASASSSPSTSPSSSPSTSPSSSPGSASWTLGGAAANGNFTAGTTPSAVSLAAYHNIGVSIQFSAPSSGSGSLSFSDALNGSLSVNDVTPNTLPADNATASYTPIIYISVVNGTSGTISFGTNLPQLTIADTALQGTYTSCNFDVYGKQGSGTTPSWFTVGVAGSVTSSGVVLGPGTLGGGNNVDFQPGQQIIAVSCH